MGVQVVRVGCGKGKRQVMGQGFGLLGICSGGARRDDAAAGLGLVGGWVGILVVAGAAVWDETECDPGEDRRDCRSSSVKYVLMVDADR